ncbi:MAG: hypothetical protein AUH41_07320 [Gemmatimonadetes bacterium 13_1_40CM_66_11]|nr:MAG: hypothetical protein AUH41_07320 [Gemmatimonadetes bacterium 13_1_40CM_66_11]OLD68449.1 MAG: hypothetical protein AUI45_10550 [Acidobacteria bacterium 13_1_40CM_2_56_11]
MPTKTIACLRVSTDKQADRGVSLDAQRAKLKAYAELRLVRSTAARRSARLGITGQGARVDRTPRYRTRNPRLFALWLWHRRHASGTLANEINRHEVEGARPSANVRMRLELR